MLLQSIDVDGTGSGPDLHLVIRNASPSISVILMGGVDHATDIVEGLQHPAVDAVAVVGWRTSKVDAVEGLLMDPY